jgi:hypothetical protein
VYTIRQHIAPDGFEDVQPFVVAVPAFGQVQGQAAPAVACGPGGDGDQVAADGGCADPGVAAAGEGAGGAEQVVREGGDGQPGGVGGERAIWQVGQGPVVQVSEELLDNGAAAVLFLGLDQLERGERAEYRVEPNYIGLDAGDVMTFLGRR